MKNDDIPTDYLHDNKHIKRRKIGVLVANFKDVLFNRTNRPVLRQNNAPPKTPAPQGQPSRVHHEASPTINHANLCPTSFSRTYFCTTPTASALHHLTFISPSVTRMLQPNNTSPTNGNPPSLDITTVLKLLPKLYELTRHS